MIALSFRRNVSSNVVVRSFPVCCVDTMFCSGGVSSTVVSDIGFSASSGGNSTGSSTGIDSGGPTSSPRGSSCPNAYPQYNTEYENGAITDDETKITIKIYETIFCM